MVVTWGSSVERCAARKCGWSRVFLTGLPLIWTVQNDYSVAGSLPETLDNLIESFVLREGTDYGEHERSLEQKVNDVKRQLKSGDVVLVWSELHETVNIMPRNAFHG